MDAQLAAPDSRDAAQDAEIAALRAELAELKAQADAKAEAEAVAALVNTGSDAAAEDLATQPTLRFYGFMDMGVQRFWGGLTELGSSETAATFVIGNINLYMDAQPSEHWRALSEVRFTTFPNGTQTLDVPTSTSTRHDTTVQDISSPNSGTTTVQWGGIILERAHIDYIASDALNIRTGYFLTPYGIWNVDHGSPTRIMVRPPLFISVGYFPERQVGVEVFGVFHVLPWDLGYHLYVSNGRAPGIDLTDDKAVGGRLWASTLRPTPFQIGASLYYGSETQVENSYGIRDGMLALNRETTVDYTEIAGGGDVSLDLGALRLRSELVARRTVYEPGKRAIYSNLPEANLMRWGTYFVAAYMLPWYGLEPLAMIELIRYPSLIADGFYYAGVGLNVYLSDSTTLRTQYLYTHGVDFTGNYEGSYKTDGQLLAARLIISF